MSDHPDWVADPDHPRHLDLEGAWNFRDLGGYVGRDGRPVRWRRLFRADGLDRLTEADLLRVEELGLRTVIDLRTGDEVAKGRIAESTGDVAWHHLPMLDVLPPREDYHDWVGPSYVAEQYMSMAESAGTSIAAFLGLLCDADAYPVVYHCFAGKDRTGILTALVLGLLGVDDADIAADYALSQLAMGRLLEWLRAQYGANVAEIESSAPAIIAAEPATMNEFLDRFRAAYGSFDAYAAGLGHPHAGALLAQILLEG
jgi:protein tyrosine/serine phosphatase